VHVFLDQKTFFAPPPFRFFVFNTLVLKLAFFVYVVLFCLMWSFFLTFIRLCRF